MESIYYFYESIFTSTEEKEQFNEKKIIIHDHWGGLGDSLQFSRLPELYSKQGYDVYISSRTPFRNKEILDLVWKLNPYVKGIIDEDGTEGVGSKVDHKEPYKVSWVYNVNLSHGFTDLSIKYPIIYYKPKKIVELQNWLIYDTTSVSTNPSDNELQNQFVTLFNRYPDKKPIRIHFTNSHVKNRTLSTLYEDSYNITTIYDLCDCIYSCAIFITGFSGSSVLSSAIKQDNETPIIHSIVPNMYHEKFKQNNLIFTFPNILYCV